MYKKELPKPSLLGLDLILSSHSMTEHLYGHKFKLWILLTLVNLFETQFKGELSFKQSKYILVVPTRYYKVSMQSVLEEHLHYYCSNSDNITCETSNRVYLAEKIVIHYRNVSSLYTFVDIS